MALRRGLALAVAAVLLLGSGCSGSSAQPQPDTTAVAVLRPTVLAEVPHDPTAFTQGLQLDGPALFEGTGLVGRSQLRELDPATGAVRREVPIPAQFFGEGITVAGNTIWQLTYQDGVAIEWDKATFTRLRDVPMDGEGWGLCWDGQRLIRSDGSSQLRFHDPADFRQTGSVPVTRAGEPVGGLNELECVEGQVWANVWPSDQIVRIDPATGLVTAVVDAAGLLDAGRRAHAQMLNGIAYAGGGEFLLTGKYWPAMFRVRFDRAA